MYFGMYKYYFFNGNMITYKLVIKTSVWVTGFFVYVGSIPTFIFYVTMVTCVVNQWKDDNILLRIISKKTWKYIFILVMILILIIVRNISRFSDCLMSYLSNKYMSACPPPGRRHKVNYHVFVKTSLARV